MSTYVYHARRLKVREFDRCHVSFDLGFHVHVTREVPLENVPDSIKPEATCYALAGFPDPYYDDPNRIQIFRTWADVEAELARHYLPPSLWRYRATMQRVIDGDTIDVRVDLGFDIAVNQRLRLAHIQVPEIKGKRSCPSEYARGIAARDYLFDLLRWNGGKMEIVTSRHGKWRRWIAEIYLRPDGRSINQQLVEAGHAEWYDDWERRHEPVHHMMVQMSGATRRRLGAHSQLSRKTHAEALQKLVHDSLEQKFPDHPPDRE